MKDIIEILYSGGEFTDNLGKVEEGTRTSRWN